MFILICKMTNIMAIAQPITDRRILEKHLHSTNGKLDDEDKKNFKWVKQHYPNIPKDVWYLILGYIDEYELKYYDDKFKSFRWTDPYRWFRWWCNNREQQKHNPLYCVNDIDSPNGNNGVIFMSTQGGGMLGMIFGVANQTASLYTFNQTLSENNIRRNGDFMLGFVIPSDVLPKIKKIEFVMSNDELSEKECTESWYTDDIIDFYSTRIKFHRQWLDFHPSFELDLDPTNCIELPYNDSCVVNNLAPEDFTETINVHLIKRLGPIPLIAMQYCNVKVNIDSSEDVTEHLQTVYTYCSTNSRRRLVQCPHKIFDDLYIGNGIVSEIFD